MPRRMKHFVLNLFQGPSTLINSFDYSILWLFCFLEQTIRVINYTETAVYLPAEQKEIPATARELFNVWCWTCQFPAPSLASGGATRWKDQSWAWGDQNAEGHLWEPISPFEKELEWRWWRESKARVMLKVSWAKGTLKIGNGCQSRDGWNWREGGERQGEKTNGEETLLICGGLFGFPYMHNEG